MEQRYNEKFGTNPDWGRRISISNIDREGRELIQSGSTTLEKYCQGIYGGLDCASFVGWSVHKI